MQSRSVLFAILLLLSLIPSHKTALAQDEAASLYARTLLEQINRYRQDNGLGPLRFDANLIWLAKHHSFEMFRLKMMSHRNFDQRFDRSGSRMCVENVGWNYSTPLKQFDAWRQSSGHDQNMLKPEITKAGIAEVGNYVTFFACK
ncbi:MAG: CAP domain-containing protein [Proteobacteria bacterium]|nr:CAP domain-containing protein [Pseudomonadota bacterium]